MAIIPHLNYTFYLVKNHFNIEELDWVFSGFHIQNRKRINKNKYLRGTIIITATFSSLLFVFCAFLSFLLSVAFAFL